MDSPLETILSDSGVDPALTAALVTDGWTSQSFREVVSNVSEFTDQLFEELCPNQPLTLLQKASLKGAWRSLQGAATSSMSSGQNQGIADAATSDSSWAETFPPKLNSSTMAALKQRFATNSRQKC